MYSCPACFFGGAGWHWGGVVPLGSHDNTESISFAKTLIGIPATSNICKISALSELLYIFLERRFLGFRTFFPFLGFSWIFGDFVNTTLPLAPEMATETIA